MAWDASKPDDDDVRQLLLAGQKIAAIKLVRERQRLDLKDAKEYVERVEGGIDPALLHPPDAGRSPGCMLLLLYALALAALIYGAVRLSR